MTKCRDCDYRLDGNNLDPYFCLIHYPCKDDAPGVLGRKHFFWATQIKDILCGNIDCPDYKKEILTR